MLWEARVKVDWTLSTCLEIQDLLSPFWFPSFLTKVSPILPLTSTSLCPSISVLFHSLHPHPIYPSFREDLRRGTLNRHSEEERAVSLESSSTDAQAGILMWETRGEASSDLSPFC